MSLSSRVIPFALVLLAACPVGAQSSQPGPPQIDPTRAQAITGLIRSSMLEYLNYRTDIQQIPVSDTLKSLSLRQYAAQVVLRDGGKIVAQVLRSGQNTNRNIVAAALQAMRSEKLPDRVTAETLARLTVEVEILGPLGAVEPKDLTARIVPGLIGSRVVRGTASASIMPSRAYLDNLSAEQTWRFCLARMPLEHEAQDLQRFWSIFATRHFVQEPGRKAAYLYRGKIPGFAERLSPGQAARRLAMRLVTSQSPAGNYRAGPQVAGLVEHIHATWILNKAREAFEEPALRKALEASVKLAMGLAAESIQRGPQGQVALAGPNGVAEAEALAWLYLAASPLETDQQGKDLLEQIADALGRRAGQAPFSEAGQESPARLPAKALAAMCLALEAARETQALEKLRRRLGAQTCRTPGELMWTVRAGVKPQMARSQSPRLAGSNRPLDETDGLIWGPAEPASTASALAALNLLEGRSWPGVPPSPRRRRQAADRLLGFCRRMVYQRPEAFFAAQPDLWTGSVRVRPGGAAVSLTSASCLLEALLGAD